MEQADSARHDAAQAPEKSAIEVAAEAFRAARIEAGLTEDQVADALKITRKRVMCIERGDLGDLPPYIYVKGYIREYERILGLEPGSIGQLFVCALKEYAHTIKKPTPTIGQSYASFGQRVSMFLHTHPGRVLTGILLIALAGIGSIAWWLFAT